MSEVVDEVAEVGDEIIDDDKAATVPEVSDSDCKRESSFMFSGWNESSFSRIEVHMII
jgi:hypothetical protein